MGHELQVNEFWVVLMKHGQVLFAAAGPYLCREKAYRKCARLNKDHKGACVYKVAERSRYILAEVLA